MSVKLYSFNQQRSIQKNSLFLSQHKKEMQDITDTEKPLLTATT